MKNKLFKFLCPAAVLLSLTACTGMKPNPKPKDEAVEAHSKLASMDEEEAAAIKEEIKIVGEDATSIFQPNMMARPSSGEAATQTWFPTKTMAISKPVSSLEAKKTPKSP